MRGEDLLEKVATLRRTGGEVWGTTQKTEINVEMPSAVLPGAGDDLTERRENKESEEGNRDRCERGGERG